MSVLGSDDAKTHLLNTCKFMVLE